MKISLVKEGCHLMIKDVTALWFTDKEIVIEKGLTKHLYNNKDYILEAIVASDGFVRSRTKPFLIDGYVNNEE